MNPISATLVWTALQVTLLGVATAVAYALARRLSPQLSAAVLATGLGLALVLTLLAASPWPRWELPRGAAADPPPLPTAEAPAAERVARPAAEAAVESPRGVQPVELEQVTLADYAANVWDALQQPAPPAAAEERGTNWLMWIVVAGVGLGVVRLLWGLATVGRLLSQSERVEDEEVESLLARTCRQLGIAQSVAVRESTELATPATVGWWRPSLLLPKQWREWTDDERQVVIAHELAHIAGRDFAGWIVARLVVALHFYHPLVHWLASRLQLEQELAADATAAQLLGNRQRYLHTLAGLALATPHHNLSGPARALIPGRSLLMRRVEMLRAPLKTIPNRTFATRLTWAQCALLALVALGIAGLRAPNLAEAQTAAPAEVAKSGTEVERIPLSLVPPETLVVASVRPSELFESKHLEPLAAQIVAAAPPLAVWEISAADIQEVLICQSRESTRTVVRFSSPSALDQVVETMNTLDSGAKVEGTARETWRGHGGQIIRSDEITLVFDVSTTQADVVVPPLTNSPPGWEDKWTSRANEHVVVVFSNRQLWESLPAEEKTSLANRGFMPMIMPALQHVELLFGNLTVDDDLKIGGVITTDSPENAEKVKSTLEAMLTLGQNAADGLRIQVAQAPPEAREAVEKLLDEGGKLLREAKVAVDGSNVTVSYVGEGEAAEVAVAAGLLLPALEQARQTAREAVSSNNFKQLALAIHNYIATHRTFPMSASTRYYNYAAQEWRESDHPHSWRVAILPILEQQALYDQYKFDEPWNSEANLKVMEQMPHGFRDPGATGDKHHTSYFALTGPETLFPADKRIGLEDVLDGTSNTLMLVEATRDIPWTKPEDIPYAKQAAVPELGGHYPGKVIVAFADGLVRPLEYPGNLEELRKMITRAGGEIPTADPEGPQ